MRAGAMSPDPCPIDGVALATRMAAAPRGQARSA